LSLVETVLAVVTAVTVAIVVIDRLVAEAVLHLVDGSILLVRTTVASAITIDAIVLAADLLIVNVMATAK